MKHVKSSPVSALSLQASPLSLSPLPAGKTSSPFKRTVSSANNQVKKKLFGQDEEDLENPRDDTNSGKYHSIISACLHLLLKCHYI